MGQLVSALTRETVFGMPIPVAIKYYELDQAGEVVTEPVTIQTA